MDKRLMKLGGQLRTFYWKYLRTRGAYADRILYEHMMWSGKTMHEDDVQSLVDDLKGKVPW